MDVIEAIRLRRSVKPEKMKPDPISEDVLRSLLEAANWAPSHGHTEPWRFIGFRGEAREALGRAICAAAEEAGSRAMPDGDPAREKIMTKVRTAPVILAIVCAASASPKIFEHEEIASTAIAVQNLHLAARAHGLAAFWSSGRKAFVAGMAEFLGLTEGQRCLGFLYLGYPATPWPESNRGPIADKITWRA